MKKLPISFQFLISKKFTDDSQIRLDKNLIFEKKNDQIFIKTKLLRFFSSLSEKD